MWVLLIVLFVFSPLSNHELAFNWLFDSMLFIDINIILMVNSCNITYDYSLNNFVKSNVSFIIQSNNVINVCTV